MAKNRGRIGENKRSTELSSSRSSMSSEKKVYGTIHKVFTDKDGTWSKPLVKVRSEDSGLLIGDIEGSWLELAEDPMDIALRFGEPKPGDRVLIIYKSSPWLGKVYMVRPDNVLSYGASEIGQDSFLIFTPGE